MPLETQTGTLESRTEPFETEHTHLRDRPADDERALEWLDALTEATRNRTGTSKVRLEELQARELEKGRTSANRTSMSTSSTSPTARSSDSPRRTGGRTTTFLINRRGREFDRCRLRPRWIRSSSRTGSPSRFERLESAPEHLRVDAVFRDSVLENCGVLREVLVRGIRGEDTLDVAIESSS